MAEQPRFPPHLIVELSLLEPPAPFQSRPSYQPVSFFYSPLVREAHDGQVLTIVAPMAVLHRTDFCHYISLGLPEELRGFVQEIVALGCGDKENTDMYNFVRSLEDREAEIVLANTDAPWHILPALRLTIYFLLDVYAMPDTSELIRTLECAPSPRALLERREGRYTSLSHLRDAILGNANTLQFLVDGTFVREAALSNARILAHLRAAHHDVQELIDRARTYHTDWVTHDRLPQIRHDLVDVALMSLGFLSNSEAFGRCVTRQAAVDMARINNLLSLLGPEAASDSFVLYPGDPQSLALATQIHHCLLTYNPGGLADDSVLMPYISASSSVYAAARDGAEVERAALPLRQESVVRHCHLRTIHGLSELLRTVFTSGDSGGAAPAARNERLILELDPLARSKTAMFLKAHSVFTAKLKPTQQALETLPQLPRVEIARAAAETLEYWEARTEQPLEKVLMNLVVRSLKGDGPFIIDASLPWMDVGARIRQGRSNDPLVLSEAQYLSAGGADLLYLASQCMDTGRVSLAFSLGFIRAQSDRVFSVHSSSSA